jgi:DNA-binding MarR family transcriptional regulator
MQTKTIAAAESELESELGLGLGLGVDGDAGSAPELPDIRGGIRLLARLARVAERTCLESGVSLPQYRLLVSASGSPQRASDLAESVGVSRPTLTALVDGLEHAGLIQRVPEPTDRRGIRMLLTDAGRVARERAEVALTRRLVALVGGGVQETFEQLSELIGKLSGALDREAAQKR